MGPRREVDELLGERYPTPRADRGEFGPGALFVNGKLVERPDDNHQPEAA